MKNKLLAASFVMFAMCTVLSTNLYAENRYEDATAEEIAKFIQVGLPLALGTPFSVSQGAFGLNSHNEKGNEYSWDLKVPLGTDVLSIADGKVIEIFKPSSEGGCDSKFSNSANNVKVEHKDGTVAQYVHVSSRVKLGEKVKKGDVVGVTNMTGWICSPHLHF